MNNILSEERFVQPKERKANPMNSNEMEVPVVGSSNAAMVPHPTSGAFSVATAVNGQSMALAQQAAAEALGMILAAQQVPRNERVCLQKIENACGRKKLAENSQYALARGGTDISGPTIHLLKAIASYWGNIKSGSVITEETQYMTKGKAIAWDLESNRVTEVPFSVKHVRYTREGTFPLKNPDDIRYLVNNYASRSERKALESVIPEDVVQQAVEWCNETLKADLANFDTTKLIEAFAPYGVTRNDIEVFAQRSLESLSGSPGHVVRLRKILTSLRDGVAKKEDFFKGGDEATAPKKDTEDAPKSDDGKKKAKVGKSVEDFLKENPPKEEGGGEGQSSVESLI